MSLILDTTTGTGANITSELALGADYTAAADCVVHLGFKLSSLTGTAANFTYLARRKTSGGVLIAEYPPSPAPIAKRTAANTAFGDAIALVPLKSGEKLEIRVLSSNASDTSIAWERNIYDANWVAGVNGLAPPTGWNNLTITNSPIIGGTGTLTITGAVATQAGTLPITTTQMLLSSGAGTGQLDFTAGVVKSNWVQILGAAITGTAAQLAAAITKFFNVATPTGTVNSLPDAVAGATGGLAIVGSAMNLATTAVQAIWDAATNALTTAGSIGKRLVDYLTGDTFAIVNNATYGNSKLARRTDLTFITIDGRTLGIADMLAAVKANASRPPAGWPVSFHAVLTNVTDNIESDFRWVPDVYAGMQYSPNGGSFPVIRAPGYIGIGAIGIIMGDRVGFFQVDGNDWNNETYDSWQWNGTTFVNQQAILNEPTYFGDIDPWPEPITGAFTNFVISAPVRALDGSGNAIAPASATTTINAKLGAYSGAGTDNVKDAVAAVAGANTGPGADQVTITWTNSTTSLPVADGDVWISTDSAGVNVVAGTLQTNSLGKATFMLDAGVTYFLFGQKDGVNSIVGQSFVAVAD